MAPFFATCQAAEWACLLAGKPLVCNARCSCASYFSWATLPCTIRPTPHNPACSCPCCAGGPPAGGPERQGRQPGDLGFLCCSAGGRGPAGAGRRSARRGRHLEHAVSCGLWPPGVCVASGTACLHAGTHLVCRWMPGGCCARLHPTPGAHQLCGATLYAELSSGLRHQIGTSNRVLHSVALFGRCSAPSTTRAPWATATTCPSWQWVSWEEARGCMPGLLA